MFFCLQSSVGGLKEDADVNGDDRPRQNALETQAETPKGSSPLQEVQGHFTLSLVCVLQEPLRGGTESLLLGRWLDRLRKLLGGTSGLLGQT